MIIKCIIRERVFIIREKMLSLRGMGFRETRTTEEVINPATGEVTRLVRTRTSHSRSGGGFLFVYDGGLEAIAGIKSPAAVRVLAALLGRLEYNRGEVRMTRGLKAELLKTADVSAATWYRAVKELERAGILTEKDGDVAFDARLFWRGDSDSRAVLLEG